MAPSEQALAELRDAHRKGIVLGLQGVSKTVERLDVDVLLTKYPKTFNLFVLALDKLQHETPPSDKMSYFQIAGKSPVSISPCLRLINDFPFQAYTDSRVPSGMGWVVRLTQQIGGNGWAIVHMVNQYSHRGTAPIWPSWRYKPWSCLTCSSY